MTAATHNKFKFIAVMLVALFVGVACFASCADSTEAASSADPSATSEVSESFVSDDASNESSVTPSDDSESESSTVSDTESSATVSNDGSESSDASEDLSDASDETSEPTESGSSGNGAGGKEDDESSFENETSTSQGSGNNGEDESSEPSEEDDTSDEDPDTSADAPSSGSGTSSGTNGSSGGSGEKPAVHGDTPIVVTINNQEYVLDSIEEAQESVSVEALGAIKKDEVFVLDTSNITLVLTSNGDGTFVSETGMVWTSDEIAETFEYQWCRKCGTRVGNGSNGTCVRYTCDNDCPRCGEECKKLACHTCDE